MPKKGQVIQKYELIRCACGCSKEFNKYDFQNRIRKYLRGHNPQINGFQKGHIPWHKGKGNIHKPKNCLKCKKIYFISKKKSKFCSKGCATSSRPGGMLGKKHSKKTREKMSLSSKGEKSYLWKGGITKKNQIIRSGLEYRLWRESVFQRDNYTCIWCGIKSQKGVKAILQADHIKPFAYFPELRFAIDNGRTLCIDCHKKTDSYLRRYKNES